MPRQPSRRATTRGLVLFAVAFGLCVLAVSVGLEWSTILNFVYGPTHVTPTDLVQRPWMYVKARVYVQGYLVQNTGAYFGDTYSLYEFDPTLHLPCPTSGCPNNPMISLSPDTDDVRGTLALATTIEYDGQAFTRTCDGCAPVKVYLIGEWVDRGMILDASRYILRVFIEAPVLHVT